MDEFPTTLFEAIEWLSSFGEQPDGGVTRTLYSPPWNLAQQALKGWMTELGFQVRFDAIGNLFGKIPAQDDQAPTILIGSHVDTVKAGGKYDGAYGIIAAILAVHHLHMEHGQPKLNLEVVSFCEEEGSRFPIACSGSGLLTGKYSFQDLISLKDEDGISFEEAMKEADFKAEEPPVLGHLRAFLEVHIEQGSTLEKNGKSIGVVQSIVGQKRFRVTVKGESNHAGTTMMKWRKDPLHGAALMIQALFEMAEGFGDSLVTTVGQLTVEPNVPNVIPSQVVFAIDARHPEVAILHSFCEKISQRFHEITIQKGLELDMEQWFEALPVLMDGQLNELVETICHSSGISYQRMHSGAGHDAQLFAPICPTTMMFVPSQRGISHSPLEYTSPHDLEVGLNVLIRLVEQLAFKGGAL